MKKILKLWIFVFYFHLFNKDIIAGIANMSKGRAKVISSLYDQKPSFRKMHNDIMKKMHKLRSLTSDLHDCSFKQMKNLDWKFVEDNGFLCGPKSVVNGYSVTMLPKGMYFYHGSETLPHGVIPGGETEGLCTNFNFFI